MFRSCFRTTVNPVSDIFLSDLFCPACVALCLQCVNECINPWSASNSFENWIRFARARVHMRVCSCAHGMKSTHERLAYWCWTTRTHTVENSSLSFVKLANSRMQRYLFGSDMKNLSWWHTRSCILVYFIGIAAFFSLFWWARHVTPFPSRSAVWRTRGKELGKQTKSWPLRWDVRQVRQ